MPAELPTVDDLLKLAKENPEALEAYRLGAVESLINSAPQNMQPRLRGLQFQIDAKRRLSKTPMAACLEISRMMFDSLHELNDLLNNQVGHSQRVRRQATANVLRFPATSNS